MRLKERGLEGFKIDSVMQQLTSLGLLNDERFTRDWVRWRDRTHPSGSQLLRYELQEKGIDEELISQVLMARETPEWREDIGVDQHEPTDLSLARDLVRRRRQRMLSIDVEKQRQRLLGLLTRRGFSQGVAYKAIT